MVVKKTVVDVARPCTCGRIQPGLSYTLDQCRICWLFAHDSRYNRLWGGNGEVVAVTRINTAVAQGLPFERPAAYTPQANDPTVGVVVGHYSTWPALVELQIKTIRHTCGSVPILIADDGSPVIDEIKTIVERYLDVDLCTSHERLGHTGGDLSALWKGIQWGAARHLRVLCKVSQRLVWLYSRWAQSAALEVLASGLPLGTRRPSDTIYPLATEAMTLDLAAWSTPKMLTALTPKRWGQDAEGVFYNILQEHMGGVYWPVTFQPPHRFAPHPHWLWHGSTVIDYGLMAEAFGITLPGTFHTDGWMDGEHRSSYVLG